LKSAAAEYGVGITKIMYDSYISYSQVREYMPYLVKNGFLEFYEDNRKYKITNKGKQLIKLYDGVEELLNATQINK
jgi:predicted transcriptional regulator